MHNAPLVTLKKLIKERYQDALAVFWAGSVSNNQETLASDLDLVIIYQQLPNAYRKAFMYDDWPIDSFVNDKDTLRFFFEESRTGSGISGLIHMILHGQEITPTSTFSASIKALAQQFMENGPAPWGKNEIDNARFLITDTLEDIQHPKSRAEQLASTSRLYEALSQFYFRSQNKWCANGKSITRYLEEDNPKFSKEFSRCFEKVFSASKTADLKKLTQKILKPYGGLLWNGFKSVAPALSKFPDIQQLELSLLTPSVRKSREQLNQLIADDFIEFGSSGRIYNKKDVLESLPGEKSKDYAVEDFTTSELSAHLILATYTVTSESRRSLRSSIWQFNGHHWQMLFHQGTNCTA